MINLDWEIKKTIQVEKQDLNQIAELKDQHWTYGIESQIDWFINNTESDDIHIMGFEQNVLKAYLSICTVIAKLDGSIQERLGVGCVCVASPNEHLGYGKALIQKANAIIVSHQKNGILLCRDELCAFYEKCGWFKLHANTIYVADTIYDKSAMELVNSNWEYNRIDISKNF